MVQWSSNSGEHSGTCRAAKPQILGTHPRVSDMVGMELDLGICIPNKLPGSVGPADPL